MSAEIEEMTKNCSKCADVQNRLPRQPLKPTETSELPFKEVASDLFEFEGNHYVLLVDCHLKFIEVDKLKGLHCSAFVEALKAQFSRHRNPYHSSNRQPYPGNHKWSPGVVVRWHCTPISYVVNCGSKEYRRNIQHPRKSTAKANEAYHRPVNEHWTEISHTLSDADRGSVDHSSFPQSPPKSGKQTLSAGQYVTRRGRIVKPPNRLCL